MCSAAFRAAVAVRLRYQSVQMGATAFRDVTEAAASLWQWWIAELLTLARLVPAWRGRAPARVHIRPDGFVLEEGEGCPRPLYELSAAVSGCKGLSARLDHVELVLNAGLCLVERTTIPSPAVHRAGSIAALRLEESTPFRRAEVCLGWLAAPIPGSQAHSALHYVIVKRAALEPIVERLFELGAGRVSARHVTAGGDGIEIRLPEELARSRSPLLRALTVVDRLCVATTIAAVIGAAAIMAIRQHSEIRRLDAEIARVQVQATEVRRVYDQAREALARRTELVRADRDAPRLLGLLEEVTRAVPDSAWLTEMRLHGRAMQLTGFARSAPDLIAALDASDRFQAVAFTAPIVRAPREAADRFNIGLELQTPEAAGEGAP